MDAARPGNLLDAFRRQAAWCREPAPFSARVLERGAAWLAADAVALAEVAAVHADPLAGAVPLRWLAALHHLALQGREPWASVWPPAAADAADETIDDAIRAAWQQERAALRRALAHPPQTNEVMRSAALLPGLLVIAARWQRPLALAEIGASAGLNLWCDRYRYAFGEAVWGDPAARPVLAPAWHGALPPLQVALVVARRAACDVAPVDLAAPGEALRLASFVWADQRERLERLSQAVATAGAAARAEGVAVVREDAAAFTRRQLATRQPGEGLVLMHSVVWQYLPAPAQADIRDALDEAGARATAPSPLAWLRLEPPRPDEPAELRLTAWPGGADTVLARGHPHGTRLQWLGDAPSGGGPGAAASSAR